MRFVRFFTTWYWVCIEPICSIPQCPFMPSKRLDGYNTPLETLLPCVGGDMVTVFCCSGNTTIHTLILQSVHMYKFMVIHKSLSQSGTYGIESPTRREVEFRTMTYFYFLAKLLWPDNVYSDGLSDITWRIFFSSEVSNCITCIAIVDPLQLQD